MIRFLCGHVYVATSGESGTDGVGSVPAKQREHGDGLLGGRFRRRGEDGRLVPEPQGTAVAASAAGRGDGHHADDCRALGRPRLARPAAHIRLPSPVTRRSNRSRQRGDGPRVSRSHPVHIRARDASRSGQAASRSVDSDCFSAGCAPDIRSMIVGMSCIRAGQAVCKSDRANEPAGKPDPVVDDHPSRHTVTGMLMRPTRKLGRAVLERLRRHRRTDAPLGLASGGVYRAAPVTRRAGGLLRHRFTLTRTSTDRGRWRSVLCGTVPRVTPGGRYPPPCPVKSGLSSAAPVARSRRDRLADSFAASA